MTTVQRGNGGMGSTMDPRGQLYSTSSSKLQTNFAHLGLPRSIYSFNAGSAGDHTVKAATVVGIIYYTVRPGNASQRCVRAHVTEPRQFVVTSHVERLGVDSGLTVLCLSGQVPRYYISMYPRSFSWIEFLYMFSIIFYVFASYPYLARVL